MELYGDEWVRKGATLSDKTARTEFGLTQDEIIAAIRAGKLQYRRAEMQGNPWLRLLRREVEDLVSTRHGAAVGGSGMHEEPDYDFFIAHAGANAAEAVNFYELLAHETKVFLDVKCLLPGDSWTIVIPRAQRRSRVTLVLISDRTEQAFYEGEEIANAIAMAREKASRHRVVPIYLAGQPPEDVPYGLRQKQALVVTDGMSVEQITKELLDLHRILTADDPTRRTEVPRVPELSGNSVRDLVDKVFCRDPVDGLPAAAELAQRGRDAVPHVVARLANLNQVDIICARTFLQFVPEESAAPMIHRILAVERDWHAAVLTADCFTPQHRPYCEDVLARHLDDNKPDVVRMCIKSLGFLGAETWAYRIEGLLYHFISPPFDQYWYDKLEHYVVPARARMLVQLESDPISEQWQLSTTFGDLERLIVATAKVRPSPATVRELGTVMAGCQPRHADHLIGWLGADHSELRLLAARALGQMRMHRAMPSLGSSASRPDVEPRMLHEAVFAVANIGGADACTLLADLLDAKSEEEATAETIRWALAHCVADAKDDTVFGQLAEDILAHPVSEICWVHRAIGLRKDDRFARVLREGTTDADPAVRGESALAIARMSGPSEQSLLLRMHAEAGPSLERVLTKLALLAAGLELPADPELKTLRAALAEQSNFYKRLITDDIIAVLEGSQNQSARPIADAWRRIYAFNTLGY